MTDALMESAERLLGDFQIYHSDLQVDSFIVNRAGGVTEYGKYFQCLREIHTRTTNLKDRRLALELLDIEIEEMESVVHTDKFAARKARIEYQRKLNAREEMVRNIADTERELARFVAHAEQYKLSVGELTPERRAELDREQWTIKLMEYATLDCLYGGRPSRDTLEIMRSLPMDIRVDILARLQNGAALEQWFLSGDRNLPQLTSTNTSGIEVSERT